VQEAENEDMDAAPILITLVGAGFLTFVGYLLAKE
jgi:hypothetical protein